MILAALPMLGFRPEEHNGPGDFMRSLCMLVTATALMISSLAWADPLAPGKPAGVHAAQMGDKEWMVFGGVGLLLASVLIATNGAGSHASVTTVPISVVTTSGTTT